MHEKAYTIANEGTFKDKITPTPHTHIAHSTPYWLASSLTTTHDGAIHNLHTFINKKHLNTKAPPLKANSHV